MFYINKKIELCLKKLDGDIIISWEDIISELGLKCNTHYLRKMAYGYKEYRDDLAGLSKEHFNLLSISDIHIPYNLPEEIFSKYSNNIDILVINGDILDCQELSKFPKEYKIDFIDEIILAREYLIRLIKLINPKIIYINDGNHDIRFGNYIAKKMDNTINSLLPTSPIQMIVDSGFYHYDKMRNKQFFYKPLRKVFKCDIHYENNYFCVIGNVIFCHPSIYSSAIMGTSKKAMEYFNSQGIDYNVIVLGHTHKLGMYKYGNKTLIEQGCVVDINKLKYFKGRLSLPQNGGYLYMQLDNDKKVIKNSIRLIEL